MELYLSVLTPLAIVFIGFWLNRRLQISERQREERDKLNRAILESKYEPHIELSINCNFFGPSEESYIAEFVLTTNNKSIIKHSFTKIRLRVRGIKHNSELLYWEGQEPRLHFPEKLIDNDIKPSNWNYIFVEPGIKQNINFISKIDKSIKYILVFAEFEYKKNKPHTVERVFELPS